MQSPQESELHSLVTQAYLSGAALHGDLNLSLEVFTEQLFLVVKKHLGENVSLREALGFIDKLHKNDLYLALGCAYGSEIGWNRLAANYRRCIRDIAASVCRSGSQASELAGSILGHLFLPGASGRSRIATYDGLSSLAAWLCAVITNQAAKQRARKCNNLERLDELPEMTDWTHMHTVETELRANRYALPIQDAFLAWKSVSDRERSLLALRYERSMHGIEIARVLDVHPSTVTRALQRTCGKLRAQIISTLASKHRLSPAAIKECVAEILENPCFSLSSLFKPEEHAPIQSACSASVINQPSRALTADSRFSDSAY